MEQVFFIIVVILLTDLVKAGTLEVIYAELTATIDYSIYHLKDHNWRLKAFDRVFFFQYKILAVLLITLWISSPKATTLSVEETTLFTLCILASFFLRKFGQAIVWGLKKVIRIFKKVFNNL